jgi:hypothetical protein
MQSVDCGDISGKSAGCTEKQLHAQRMESVSGGCKRKTPGYIKCISASMLKPLNP